MAKNKTTTFEEALARLEEITQKMETGDLTLDESLKLFEEGVGLSRFCEKKLVDAETKVRILQSTDIEDSQELNEKAQEEQQIEEPEKTKKSRHKKKELLCSTDEETQDETSFLF